MATTAQKRIWGWMAFDWATQPIYTLGLTFIFGPYFAAVATDFFLNAGQSAPEAKANAQSMWSLGQSIAGIFIAISAPILGAWADMSGRKIPWIAFFSVIYVVTSWMMWGLTPDGSTLAITLVIFYVCFFAAESALNFTNAFLPSLGNDKEIGRISGAGASFGYWGGLIALVVFMLFFVDTDGKTFILERAPAFGLDPAQNEGTRAVGPFIAIWFAVFMIPFFLWVRDDKPSRSEPVQIGRIYSELMTTLKNTWKNRSLTNFLIGSMLYRDALNALYAFGGVYAVLVLDWETMQVGIFGIIGVIAAAIATWIGGRCDARFGPKPVIMTSVTILILVCIIIVSMNREHIGPIAIPAGSSLPDLIFMICGSAIGGAGGALYASSRSMMVRHTNPDRPTEAFGLFALTGKATAFLAPMLIGIVTYLTQNAQLGFVPVIVLFLLGMLMLRWVNSEGDRAEWSAH